MGTISVLTLTRDGELVVASTGKLITRRNNFFRCDVTNFRDYPWTVTLRMVDQPFPVLL